MAFLRFTRDKRGYEHFYLVEATTNRRGKTRARVLYWFRTPPNVKIGREPFDADVRAALESQHPGVTFDWRKIVETPIPSADAERWRERRRLEKAEKAARRAERAGGEAAVPAASVDAEAATGAGVDADAEIDEQFEPAALDAAEQLADQLAPTEESLVSESAHIDVPVIAARAARTATAAAPRAASKGHRRRRPRPAPPQQG